MKTLFLFRHAKTEKAIPGQDDHGRTLLAKGIEAASHVGASMRRYGTVPDVILCSDAVRTRRTAEVAGAAIGRPIPMYSLSELYTAGVEDIAGILSGRSEDCIMIVGHNPTIEEAVETFGGDYHRMRPGYCIMLVFEIEKWEELAGHPLPLTHRLYKPADDEEE